MSENGIYNHHYSSNIATAGVPSPAKMIRLA
jgi:hypothetical protein